MKTICLVACASRKRDGPRAAEQLYDSALFDGSRHYAKTRSDKWCILSAKHGLTAPSSVLAPYDESLIGATPQTKKAWAVEVFHKLDDLLDAGDRVIFLAGKPYREYLTPLLNEKYIQTAAPLENLGIGSQVSWLQGLMREKTRIRDLDRMYSLLEKLRQKIGGARPLASTSAKSIWPDRGLYIFFEPNQFRMSAPFQSRVVRVGTHSVSEGSKTSLWNRLRTHRGAVDLSGNHRGSIFRLHVGNALRSRHSVEGIFPTWSIGQSASKDIRVSEQELEKLVSEYIGEMSVLWLDINDKPGPQSDRAYLERNLIGLICGPTGPIDLGSGEWLGKASIRDEISKSGLWNLNYLGFQYDPRMLDVLEKYVDVTIGLSPKPTVPLAPANWHAKTAQENLGQLPLI